MHARWGEESTHQLLSYITKRQLILVLLLAMLRLPFYWLLLFIYIIVWLETYLKIQNNNNNKIFQMLIVSEKRTYSHTLVFAGTSMISDFTGNSRWCESSEWFIYLFVVITGSSLLFFSQPYLLVIVGTNEKVMKCVYVWT